MEVRNNEHAEELKSKINWLVKSRWWTIFKKAVIEQVDIIKDRIYYGWWDDYEKIQFSKYSLDKQLLKAIEIIMHAPWDILSISEDKIDSMANEDDGYENESDWDVKWYDE